MASTLTRPGSLASVFAAPPEADGPGPDGTVTDIAGRVPDGLVGALYRNGPGKLDLADHLFDGDGMVSKVTFGPEGSVHFRNRFVQTRKYKAELGATASLHGGFGTRRRGGVLTNAFRPPTGKANAANTGLLFTAGRLLALWEGGHPWQIDPDTLETVGEMDFDGVLSARMPFSAHPHWDPTTKEIFNFGMVYGPRTSLATYRIDPHGRMSELARIPAPGPVFNHDFIITDRWLVFFLNPLAISLVPFLLGKQSINDSLRYDANGATRVVLVPRDGGDVVMFDAEPWFQYHYGAAFDDGDDIVVDFVRYPEWEAIGKGLKQFRTSDLTNVQSPLVRARISPARQQVETKQITEGTFEFPQVDARRYTGGYRTLFAAESFGHPGLLTGIARVDTATGDKDSYDFGAGHVVSEPLFVPRPGGEGDDDGWLVGTVHEPDRGSSAAYVLDARSPSAGPLCLAHLPVNTGVSFHGAWRRA